MRNEKHANRNKLTKLWPKARTSDSHQNGKSVSWKATHIYTERGIKEDWILAFKKSAG